MGVITRTTFDLMASGGALILPGGPFDGITSGFGMQWGVTTGHTPFNFGKVLRTSAFFAGDVYKNMATNESTIYFMMRLECDSGPFAVSWDDVAGTRQVDIEFDGVSDIIIKNAHGELGRWRNAFFEGQNNHFQVRTTIDHATGSVRIRRNGKTADDYELCNVDTQETAHAYANAVRLTTYANSTYSYIDDFAAWDQQGPGPWNTWMGEMRAMGRMAKTDKSVVMVKTHPALSTTFGFTANVTAQTMAPNHLWLYPVTVPPIGGQLDDLVIAMDAGFTGHLQAGLYDAGGYYQGIEGNGAAPGSLLASTTPLVNPVTGNNTLAWSGTKPSVVTGAQYWLGLWADALFRPRFDNVGNGGVDIGAAYTGSLPDPFRADLMNVNNFALQPTLSTTLTITNAGCVDEPFADGATTMVSSDTIGDEDLYGIEPLPPKGFKNILGLDFSILYAKSTAGTRGITPILKSGATEVDETEVFPNTSFNYSKYAQDVDPNTSAAWVKADVDALEIGQKVSS